MIFGHMVTRNEAHRYLESSLKRLTEVCDEVFVYDDRSTDATTNIALELGCVVSVRQKHDPTFLEHQGKFRQNGWDLLETLFKPSSRDWILCIDADEIFLPDRDRFTNPLMRNAMGVRMNIQEVFDYKINEHNMVFRPKIRVDGFWGKIYGTRAARYLPGGVFRNKPMGCGSVPLYAETDVFYDAWNILHLGYATCEDRFLKHEKFTSHPNHGHNPQHIASILSKPILTDFVSSIPEIRRGSSYED